MRDLFSLCRKLAMLILLVLFVSSALRSPAGAKESTNTIDADDGERSEAKDLAYAKQLHSQQMDEINRKAARIVEEGLRAAREQAEQFKARESVAVRQQLLAAYDRAIDRTITDRDLAAASALTAEKQTLLGLELPSADFAINSLEDGTLYRSMLGRYGQHGGKEHPVVNLSVPRKDLWVAAIQDKLRGRIDFHEINYRGEAKLVVPQEGIYNFAFPQHTEVRVNGNAISSGDVTLRKGVYSVRIDVGTHGGNYIVDSYVRVMAKDTNQEVPLVNSGADIKQFLLRPVDGRGVAEVSAYKLEPVDVAVPPAHRHEAGTGVDSPHVF